MTRRGVGAAVVVGLVVVLVGLGGIATPAGRAGGPAEGSEGPIGGADAAPGPGGTARPEDGRAGAEAVPFGPVLMAGHASGLELRVPSAGAVLVGFHEASTPHAQALVPIGTLVVDRNAREARPGDDARGPAYRVLPSRGRGFASTSSVDVVVADGAAVLAPVTGTVLLVRDYALYGRHPDVRLELVPDAAPGLRVVLIHLEGVRVAEGDRVVAGVTVLADAGRRFPFASQVDDELARRYAHVHLEVQDVDAPRPFLPS